MKNNNRYGNLLAVNNRSLQDLHCVLGFDFCKPFDVLQINEKYTVKKIEKAALNIGHNSKTSKIALCTRDKETPWRKDFCLVTIDGGKVNTEYKTPYHSVGRGL